MRTIKRYQNRKFYDVKERCYVSFAQIKAFITKGEEVYIYDNKTKEDITRKTLLSIAWEMERLTTKRGDLSALKDLITQGDGSFSSYFERTP